MIACQFSLRHSLSRPTITTWPRRPVRQMAMAPAWPTIVSSTTRTSTRCCPRGLSGVALPGLSSRCCVRWGCAGAYCLYHRASLGLANRMLKVYAVHSERRWLLDWVVSQRRPILAVNWDGEAERGGVEQARGSWAAAIDKQPSPPCITADNRNVIGENGQPSTQSDAVMSHSACQYN